MDFQDKINAFLIPKISKILKIHGISDYIISEIEKELTCIGRRIESRNSESTSLASTFSSPSALLSVSGYKYTPLRQSLKTKFEEGNNLSQINQVFFLLIFQYKSMCLNGSNGSNFKLIRASVQKLLS
jgi:hypothetical protein